MGKRILGIDIQHDAVAAVIVNRGFKGNSVEAHAYIPFPEKPEGENRLEAALHILVKELDVTECVCASSLPSHHASFRNLRVPFKQEKRIRQILPFELEPTLPFPVEDVIIDYHVIQTALPDEQTELIAAAYDSKNLAKHLELLAAFGLDPEMVTIGGYPAAVLLCRLGELPGDAMLVDFGVDVGTLFTLTSGNLRLIRSIPPVSGDISRTEHLCQNIKRTLYALEESGELDYRPESIYITGPETGNNGIENKFSGMLNIPVRKTSLVRDVDAGINEIPMDGWVPHRMDNALALALLKSIGVKGINFRKGPFAIRKRWAEYKKNIVTSGALAGALLLIMLTYVFVDFYTQNARLAALKAETEGIFRSTFPEVTRIVDPQSQMAQKIKELRISSLLPSEAGVKPLIIDILNEISQRIPADIDAKFSRMVIGDESVVISGDTDTFNSVDTVKVGLEKAEMFSEVTIVSTNKDNAANRIRFRIKFKVQS